LLGREIEYVSITQDTSEADLKQRKEVTNNGTRYVNQAPVRAALNGRLLILDGLEKAERNVLPTLNNLLENRELPLDDGSMLVSPDVYNTHKMGIAVHKDFRVVGLASLDSVTLDPPLRSRFQARLASSVDVGDMLITASALSDGQLDTNTMKSLVQSAGGVHGVSLEAVHDAVRYLEMYQHSIAPTAALRANGINTNEEMISADDIVSPLQLNGYEKRLDNNMSNFVETQTTKGIQDLILAGFESGKRSIALVGPKGCYKSTVARNLAHSLDEKCELMSLYPDLTARDLLMTRGTCEETGDTVWRETALTRAAKNGSWVILDGIDKLRSDTLTSLALMIEQGLVVLPDGKQFEVNDRFRCIAIGHPSTIEKPWITPEVKEMFHWIEATPLYDEELRELLSQMFPSLKRKVLNKILTLHEKLDDIDVDSDAEKESMQLTLRKLKHICKRTEQRPSELGNIIHSTLLTNFLPDWERGIIDKCLSKSNIIRSNNTNPDYDSLEDLIISCKRKASKPLLVPNVHFEMNQGQSLVMQDILEAHSVGERALLILGYQGVGKNKIVDHLLGKLNAEREYLQLHRDTTIQSLLISPSVEDGRIVYNDSPLVRAAREGRILVLDEADKAPVEVVAVLKGLIEDGQLSLPDGRMLMYGNSDSPGDDDSIIRIHKDFSIWALANPSGYPFHGNDLAREMSDVFSCHTVPPLDIESHKRILMSYGEHVSPKTIDKIVNVWESLRRAHQEGSIIYPFSVRESVAVVKHLNQFPDDGIEDAVDNVIAFDRLDDTLSKHLHRIFSSRGISVFSGNYITEKKLWRAEGGVSTPKTRSGAPKHGKEDPNNDPHVGGNTWAGGSGG